MDRVPAVPPVERDDVVGGSKSGAMSRRSIVRAIGLATAATLLTAGCAAGQVAQTQYEKASIDGIDTSVGKVDLRGLAVEAPTSGTNFYKPGTAAQLRVVFLNNSTAADTLVSITGKGIGGWSVYSSYAQAAQVQNALGAPPAAPTRSLSPVASGTGSGTQAVGSSAPGSPTSPAGSSSPAAATSSSSSSPASATASAPSAPTPSSSAPSSASLPKGTRSVTLPTGARVSFGTPEAVGALLLIPITGQIRSGTVLQLTFTFRNAGTRTIPVPVQLGTYVPASVSGGSSGG